MLLSPKAKCFEYDCGSWTVLFSVRGMRWDVIEGTRERVDVLFVAGGMQVVARCLCRRA
jgi:hypothetical protein